MRLSVIIPAIGPQQATEDSLVSVLSNRPPCCEILAVCDDDFVDAYDLGEEVRFVRYGRGGSWAEAANEGLRSAGGTYVALLLPGTEVVEGWAEVAMRRMDRHPRLASVAPLVLDENLKSRGIAGLGFTLGGRRRVRTAHLPAADDEPALCRIDGPCRWGGFFRRQALLEVEGWDTSIALELADLELAVRLRAAGWRSRCELSSWVRVRSALDTEIVGYRNARDAERIFWRYLKPPVRVPALLIHPAELFFERLRRVANPAAIGELLGRLAGCRSAAREGFLERTGTEADRRAA